MQLKYDKYPAYKDSGVEWLGEIPEGWEVKKLKFNGTIYAGLNGKKGDDFSKEYKHGMIPFIPFTNIYNNMIIDDSQFQYVRILDNEAQNIVIENDLLFLMSSETIDDIGKCSLYKSNIKKLYLNSFCKGFRINKKDIDANFTNYLLKAETYRAYFSMVGRGFTRINIKQEYINDLYTLTPPLLEQNTIAQHLDQKTKKIDQAIAQKEKMIALLKERKQIMIQELVTGKMVWDKETDSWIKPKLTKDSGVEWIGEIPEGWEVKKCKYLFNEINERSVEGKEELLSVSHMTGVTPRSEKDVNMFLAEDYSGSKLCKKGDVVYNIMWAWMGALGVSWQEGIVSPSYGIYRQKNSNYFNLSFLENKLKTTEYIEYYNKVSTGLHSSRLRFYSHMFMNMVISFPRKEIQDTIINRINQQSSKIDQAITLQLKQIGRLKEYKMVLIDSLVTGKVKI